MSEPEALGREYLLHEEIGRGALAVVRRATSRFGGPPLAAKLLRPEYAGDKRVRELLLREEMALRDLEHPSIVGIRDLVVEGGTVALLMDHVAGPDLRTYLAQHDLTPAGRRLPFTEACWIGAQTAAALAVAHAQGVVHLDLKPSNVLVVGGTDPVRVRISDFGVAALLLHGDAAARGGTPGYMAPEIAAGGPATAAADVYAVGVLVRELLGGAVPDTLAPAIAACTDPDPRNRPSARALAVQLRAASTGRSEAAAAPGPAASGASPAVAATGAAAAAAGAAAVTGAAAGGSAGTSPAGGSGAAPPLPPPPPFGGSDRRLPWRRGPLVTLAVGALAAAVIAGFTVNAAADQRQAATTGPVIPAITASSQAPPASSAPPAAKPPTDNLGQSAPADRTRATYAGHVDDDAGTLAISLRDGVAIAYICDGKRVEEWLRGTVAGGAITLKGKKGGRLTATFDGKRATGSVTVQGRTNTFSIAIAKKPSGMYRAAARVRNARVVGSWIVLQDGRQVGVLTADEVPSPAPALDVTGRRTTVEGATVPASTIDVDSGEGF